MSIQHTCQKDFSNHKQGIKTYCVIRFTKRLRFTFLSLSFNSSFFFFFNIKRIYSRRISTPDSFNGSVQWTIPFRSDPICKESHLLNKSVPKRFLSAKQIRYSLLVYGLFTNICFSSTRVGWWLINKNVIFLLSSLHFYLPFGFVFICMRSWESWNFRILCIKKHRFTYAQTINEWRISKRSVVLLRRQNTIRNGSKKS